MFYDFCSVFGHSANLVISETIIQWILRFTKSFSHLRVFT